MLGHLLTNPALLKLWRSDWLMKIILLKLVIGKALTMAWVSIEVDNRTFTEDLSC